MIKKYKNVPVNKMQNSSGYLKGKKGKGKGPV